MKLTLPDNSSRELPKGSSGYDLAKDIGPGLAKSAVAMTINGVQKDLCDVIENDASVSIITIDSNNGIEIMRHTLTAQVLARAIKNLYPNSKLAIGPTIEDGFYYDVESDEVISSDDLIKIEDEMRRIIKTKSAITKKLVSKSEALKIFKSKKESYKEIIINESDQTDSFQLYFQDDENFVDLCRGPHLPSLSFIGAFKLTKVAGAYWKGDSKNSMLTRIYGTAFNNDKDLQNHLDNIEEALKRDHRKIGKEMNLFHFQDEAPGMVFWHPNGWTIYRNLRNFVRDKLQSNGYIEVNTPQVIDRKLWEASGHWDKYRENMFITEIDEEHANEKRINALKPMNCPGHVQIYNQGIKSYKDLPLKYAEFGLCHRYEPSGTMHGLMRVRAFTQDDGHIFCTEDQIESETKLFIDFLSEIYADLGFTKFDIKLSTRPEMRVGSDKTWDKAEEALESAINNLGHPYRIDHGDGAFYGPKLDFVLTDAIGREWQCGTFQLDFNLAERLDAQYVGEDGKKHFPVMIHRAVLGSFERFIGILIENYAGKLPLWLAPIQIMIAPIISDANDYADTVKKEFVNNGFRVEIDKRNEKISYKVREHSLSKIPYILALGKKEIADNTVNVRKIGSKDTNTMKIKDFLNELKTELKESNKC
ncbi:MAG: threonine--tRNA ligase [SAR86 cluster bacterium]|jgi:threonyl-tRNA synthetase|nr:MAG: threonine--tRNA ligase [SAR86 cluster bacterium]|tara:strand:+ start:1802 stop:3739 length:1938 start_codon:yes stop_codon:yes gene_type:complete